MNIQMLLNNRRVVEGVFTFKSVRDIKKSIDKCSGLSAYKYHKKPNSMIWLLPSGRFSVTD